MNKLFQILTVISLGVGGFLAVKVSDLSEKLETSGKANIVKPENSTEIVRLSAELKQLQSKIDELKLANSAPRLDRQATVSSRKVKVDEEALQKVVDKRVEEVLAEKEKTESKSAKKGWGKVKVSKTTLAEVAKELEIDEITMNRIKDIRRETTNKIIGLLLKENETVEDYLQRLELAQNDPQIRKQMQARITDVWESGGLKGMHGIYRDQTNQFTEILDADRAERFNEMLHSLNDQPDIFLKR